MEGKLVIASFAALVLLAVAFFAFNPADKADVKTYNVRAEWNLAQDAAPATSESPQSVELTVYQIEPQNNYYYRYDSTGFNVDNGLALIKETRKALFPQGMTAFSMKGTAQYIDSTSLHFKDLTDDTAAVLEQNYNYDLVSQDKLLEKYIDSPITVKKGNSTITGTLLTSGGGVVLQTSKGLVALYGYDEIDYPSLPAGLITKPTINWLLESGKAGEHEIQASYLASGLNWKADYVAVANANDDRMDIQGWVSLSNKAGATFTDAKLKLVAGDINLVRGTPAPAPSYARMDAMGASEAKQQFTQENLFEYHLYTLQRPTTLKDNEDKQVSLLEGSNVPVVKKFVFEPDKSEKMQVKLEFENKKANGLGLPLPKGKVRVYKADSEGQLQFLGEDAIDHTPEDEKVRLFLGNAFDVAVEHKQTDYQSYGSCSSQTSYSTQIRNHKKEAIQVQAFSPSLSGEWQVRKETAPHTKDDSRHALWTLDVPADGTVTLEYSVQQDWC